MEGFSVADPMGRNSLDHLGLSDIKGKGYVRNQVGMPDNAFIVVHSMQECCVMLALGTCGKCR